MEGFFVPLKLDIQFCSSFGIRVALTARIFFFTLFFQKVCDIRKESISLLNKTKILWQEVTITLLMNTQAT